jgi:hypothetical protein
MQRKLVAFAAESQAPVRRRACASVRALQRAAASLTVTSDEFELGESLIDPYQVLPSCATVIV